MNFIEACRKFISIDSSPHFGNLELAKYAAELCRAVGLVVDLEVSMLNGIEQANVVARPSEHLPSDELLLQTHLDTVDPGPYALWTKTGANPFEASIYKDPVHGSERFYGLGAADVKLDFLCKLAAIEEIGLRREWRLPFALAGTYGEELGMHGAVKLVRNKKISAKQALVGEPTELRLMTAGKGIAAVEIEIPFSAEELAHRARHDSDESVSTQSRMFMGRAAHSSAPHLGESAILKMFEYLAKLPSGIVTMEIDGGASYNTIPANAVLEIDMVADAVSPRGDTFGAKLARVMRAVAMVERQFAKYPAEAFAPPLPTLNIGMVRTRADRVVMLGCCRLPPSVTQDAYEGWMSILRTECEQIGAVFRVTEHKRPFVTDENSPLVQACRGALDDCGLESTSACLSSTIEASVFSRLGIESVAIGAGQGVGNSHAPNEHVKVERLRDAIRFYKGAIERICL